MGEIPNNPNDAEVTKPAESKTPQTQADNIVSRRDEIGEKPERKWWSRVEELLTQDTSDPDKVQPVVVPLMENQQLVPHVVKFETTFDNFDHAKKVGNEFPSQINFRTVLGELVKDQQVLSNQNYTEQPTVRTADLRDYNVDPLMLDEAESYEDFIKALGEYKGVPKDDKTFMPMDELITALNENRTKSADEAFKANKDLGVDPSIPIVRRFDELMITDQPTS